MRPDLFRLVVGAGLLAGVPASSGVAQVLHGRVVEEGTGAPVATAEVYLFHPDRTEIARIVTDSAGVFRVVLPGAGSYVLNVHRIGFFPWRSEPIALGRQESIKVEIRLGRAATALEPIVVVARAPVGAGRLAGFRERQRTSATGTFVTREDLERRPTADVTDVLRGISGLTIMPVRISGSQKIIHLIAGRGVVGPCLASVWLDGILADQSASFPVDELVRPEELEGIEVYRSEAAVPPQYMQRGRCGAVVLWTRDLEPEGGRSFSLRRLTAGLGLFGAVAFLMSR